MVPMRVCFLFILIFVSIIPPLTDDERLALLRVRDGGGFVESSSLDILINHVKGWESGDVDDEIPVVPFSFVMKEPGKYRGELFFIRGKLLRRDRRPLGRSDLEAWIILPDSEDHKEADETAMTLAVLLPVTSFDEDQYSRLPVAMRVPARFFARLVVPDHSGSHADISLPLFVGSFPQVIAPAALSVSSGTRMMFIVVFLVVTGLIWILIRILTARGRKQEHLTTHGVYDDEIQVPSPPLPEEPAEALSVLYENSATPHEQG